MNEDIVYRVCKECGWVHEAVLPTNPRDDQKYTHCQNCFADYTEFLSFNPSDTLNVRRYKPGLKILMD